MNNHALQVENWAFSGTGGVSQTNSGLGFRPAFRDRSTGRVEISRLGNGSPAGIHLIDGLPDEWVAMRREDGSVRSLLPTIESGFMREGAFYTREQTADLLS